MPERLIEFPDGPRKPRRKSTNARSAAIKYARPALSKRQALILRFVVSKGDFGVTREEISTATGIPLQSVCDPVLQLLRQGLIRENGKTRKTSSGSQAAILVAVVPQVEGLKSIGDLAADSLRRHGIEPGEQP